MDPFENKKPKTPPKIHKQPVFLHQGELVGEFTIGFPSDITANDILPFISEKLGYPSGYLERETSSSGLHVRLCKPLPEYTTDLVDKFPSSPTVSGRKHLVAEMRKVLEVVPFMYSKTLPEEKTMETQHVFYLRYKAKIAQPKSSTSPPKQEKKEEEEKEKEEEEDELTLVYSSPNETHPFFDIHKLRLVQTQTGVRVGDPHKFYEGITVVEIIEGLNRIGAIGKPLSDHSLGSFSPQQKKENPTVQLIVMMRDLQVKPNVIKAFLNDVKPKEIDVHFGDELGRSLLHYSVMHKYVDFSRMLIEQQFKASTEMRDVFGLTPRDYAHQSDSPEIAKLFGIARAGNEPHRMIILEAIIRMIKEISNWGKDNNNNVVLNTL